MSKEQTENELKNFTHNVVYLRKEYGYSKSKMSKILNIGIGSLNKLEKGEVPQRMTIKPIINVWKHFGIHPKNQLETRLKKKKVRFD